MFKGLTGIRAFVLLLGCLLFVLVEANCATYYTAASGEISGNIWSTTTNGTPGALPALVNGDIIYIDDNISITAGNFTEWQNVRSDNLSQCDDEYRRSIGTEPNNIYYF